MRKPKPCPFCGQDDELRLHPDAGDILCDTCGAHVSIDSWANRPIEDAKAAEIAQLRGVLLRLIRAASLSAATGTPFNEGSRALIDARETFARRVKEQA